MSLMLPPNKLFYDFVFSLFSKPGLTQSRGGIWEFKRNNLPEKVVESFASDEDVIKETRCYLFKLNVLWEQHLRNSCSSNSEEQCTLRIANMISDAQVMVSTQGNDANRVQDCNKSDRLVAESFTPQANPTPSELSPTVADVGKKDHESPRQKIKIFPSGLSFVLPNAMVGKEYFGKIEVVNSNGYQVIVLDAIVPGVQELSFNPQTCELTGNPRSDGEFKVALRYTFDRIDEFSANCSLIINPDPRKLWKNIEPPADAAFFKSNSDSLILANINPPVIAASRRGRSHEHSGTFRDDDFFVNFDPISRWYVLIVADGAGSAKFSRRGSQVAVNTFGNHLALELKSDVGNRLSTAIQQWSSDPAVASKRVGTDFHYLFHKASLLAVQSIENEASATNSSFKDFSTTLLAAVARFDGNNLFVATFWIGDGAIAVYGPPGKIRLMGSPDSGEFAGQTRFLDRASLADQSFSKRVVVGYYNDLTALILMTDGVSDPIFETDNGLAQAAKWDEMWNTLNPLIRGKDPEKSLLNWLDFFTPGHHDDRTIVLLASPETFSN